MKTLLYMLCVIAILIVLSQLASWKRRIRMATLRALAAQNECQFMETLPLEQLAHLNSPPWDTFRPGVADAFAREAIVFDCPAGRIIAADFSVAPTRDNDKRLAFSVICVQVAEPAQVASVATRVLQLERINGVHLLMRGDCVYAMLATSLLRSTRMCTAEKIACMQALSHLLYGDVGQARNLLREVRRVAGSVPVFFTVVGIMGVAWLADLMLSFEADSFGGELLVGSIFFICLAVGFWRAARQNAPLHEYLSQTWIA